MKNFNLSLFLGCCVISIGIIIAGVIISNHLPPVLSGSFSGTLTQSAPQEYSDYMSVYEASAFVQISRVY